MRRVGQTESHVEVRARSVRFARRGTLVAIGVCCGALSIGCGLAVRGAIADGEPVVGLMLGAMALVFAASAWRFPVLGVTVSDSEVVVRQIVRTVQVPIGDVVDCRAVRRRGGGERPALLRTTGPPVTLMGIESGLAREFGSPDEGWRPMLDRIDAEVRSRRSPPA